MKADLITGFLGAGKTTFLKYYTRWLTSKGLRVGILVNDHGAVNVDVLLLDELRSERCEVEMVSAACGYDMHRLRFKTKLIQMAMDGAYDRLLVEPSGVFDVDEFFDLLYESPLDRWYERGSVIAVVDAHLGLADSGTGFTGTAPAACAAGTASKTDAAGTALAADAAGLSEESEYLLMTQTANAGLVVLSRVQELAPNNTDNTAQDSTDSAAQDSTENAAQDNRNSMRQSITPQDSAALIRDVISGTAARINRAMERFSCDRRIRESEILAKDWDSFTEEDWQRILRSEYRGADHIKLQIDRENRFSSVFYMNEKLCMTEEALRALAEELLNSAVYGRVLRVKGTVLSPEGDWIEVNAAGPDLTIRKTTAGQDILIIIGEDLKKEALDRRVRGTRSDA